ncbi:MAG: putative secreted protein [Paracoccaceae bacterium]|jgi:predicted secreted protein
MTWFSAGLVFVVVWWLVFFVSLPFGARSFHEAGEAVDVGNESSAPMRPRVWLKAGISTVIAIILTIGVYFLIDSGALSFRP